MFLDFSDPKSLYDGLSGHVLGFTEDEDNVTRNFILGAILNPLMTGVGITATVFTYNLFDLVFNKILNCETASRFPESIQYYGRPEYRSYQDMAKRDILDPAYRGTVLIHVDQRKEDILTSLRHMRDNFVLLHVPSISPYNWDMKNILRYAAENNLAIVLLAPDMRPKHIMGLLNVEAVDNTTVQVSVVKSKEHIELTHENFHTDQRFNTYACGD